LLHNQKRAKIKTKMLSRFVKLSRTSPWTFKKDITKIVKETCKFEENKDFQINKQFSQSDFKSFRFTGEWLFKFEDEKKAKILSDFVQNNPIKMHGEGELKAFYVWFIFINLFLFVCLNFFNF